MKDSSCACVLPPNVIEYPGWQSQPVKLSLNIAGNVTLRPSGGIGADCDDMLSIVPFDP